MDPISLRYCEDRGCYSYSISRSIHSGQRRNSLVPTPRFCHVEDFRSGHGTILKEVTVVCSRIDGSLGRGGFLGVGAGRYPGLQGPWFDYCPNSERRKGSAWDSRSGRSLVAWSLVLRSCLMIIRNTIRYDYDY